jgi:hypothetical protein
VVPASAFVGAELPGPAAPLSEGERLAAARSLAKNWAAVRAAASVNWLVVRILGGEFARHNLPPTGNNLFSFHLIRKEMKINIVSGPFA